MIRFRNCLPQAVPARTVASLLALMIALLFSGPALAQSSGAKPQADLSGYRPTALEITQLPPYCWGQFNPQFRGAGMAAYNIPRGCGKDMGHFCPALVSLQRAKKGNNRSYWINVAEDHMGYTLDRLGDPKKCPIADDIHRYAAEIRSLRAKIR